MVGTCPKDTQLVEWWGMLKMEGPDGNGKRKCVVVMEENLQIFDVREGEEAESRKTRRRDIYCGDPKSGESWGKMKTLILLSSKHQTVM